MKNYLLLFFITVLSSCNIPHKDYYENGNVKGVLYKDGTFITYYENGIKKSEGVVKHEAKEGIYKEYDENGNLKTLIDGYLKGKRNGLQIEYEQNKKTREAEFKNDLHNGIMKEYYSDGSIKSERYFLNGLMHGTFQAFYQNKKPLFIAEYLHDEPVCIIEYDSLGNKISEFRKVLIFENKDTITINEKYSAKIFLPGIKEGTTIVYNATTPERIKSNSDTVRMRTLKIIRDTAIYEFTPTETGTYSFWGTALIMKNDKIESSYRFEDSFIGR